MNISRNNIKSEKIKRINSTYKSKLNQRNLFKNLILLIIIISIIIICLTLITTNTNNPKSFNDVNSITGQFITGYNTLNSKNNNSESGEDLKKDGNTNDEKIETEIKSENNEVTLSTNDDNQHVNNPKEITEQEAFFYLNRAKQDIDEMNFSNFKTFYVKDLYIKAKKEYEGENLTLLRKKAQTLKESNPSIAISLIEQIENATKNNEKIGENYSKVKELSEQIQDRKEKTYYFFDELEYLEFNILFAINNSDNLNTSEINKTFEQAKKEFVLERFESIEDLINQTYILIDDAIIDASRMNAMIKASRRTFGYFIITHIPEIIITIIILTLIGLICYNEYLINSLKKKQTNQSLENDVMINLLIKAEKDYYQTKTISKSFFMIKITRYKEKMLKIKQNKPIIKGYLDKAIERRKYYLAKLLNKIKTKDHKKTINKQ